MGLRSEGRRRQDRLIIYNRGVPGTTTLGEITAASLKLK